MAKSTTVTVSVEDAPRFLQVLDELDQWRKHGVLITEDCKECDGTGWVKDDPECDHPDASLSGCPRCSDGGVGGTGKVLRDGAAISRPVLPTDARPPMVFFPESWLEEEAE